MSDLRPVEVNVAYYENERDNEELKAVLLDTDPPTEAENYIGIGFAGVSWSLDATELAAPTIRVYLSAIGNVIFEADLAKAIDDFIDTYSSIGFFRERRPGETFGFDDEYARWAKKLADTLRASAAKLDAELAHVEQGPPAA